MSAVKPTRCQKCGKPVGYVTVLRARIQQVDPGDSSAPLHPEAAFIYPFGKDSVRIIVEPQKRFASQQPSEVEIFILQGFCNGMDRN